MAQTFSVNQLKLNSQMLTGSVEGLFFNGNQVAFGTNAVPVERLVVAGSGLTSVNPDGSLHNGSLNTDLTLDVNADGQWGAGTLHVVNDILQVKDGGITAAKLAGSIGNSLLDDPTFNVSPDGGLTGDSPVSLGGTLSIGVNVDGSSLEIRSDEVGVKDLGITNALIANSTIQNAKLANDNFNVSPDGGLTGASNVALGGSLNLGVNVDDSSIELSSDQIRVKDGGITNAMLNGSISNANLANSSLTVTAGDGLKDGGAVSLGGGVTINVDVSDFAGDGLADDGSENLKVDPTVIRVFGGQTIYQPAGSDPALSIEGTASIKDLSITGTLTAIASNDLVVTDNIITLNTGDPGLVNGTGISLGTAGIEIWRGSGDWGDAAGQQIAGYDGDGVVRAQLLYNDNPGKDYWEAGLEGDMNMILLSRDDHTGYLVDVGKHDVLSERIISTGQTLWTRDETIQTLLQTQIDGNDTDIAANLAAIQSNDTDIANLNTLKADKVTDMIAGLGLVGGGTLASNRTFNVGAGAGITVGEDDISIATNAITNAMIANSTVSYGGVTLNLGGSDATPAFNLSDATDYKTTNLVGTITNSQLVNDDITVTAGSGVLLSTVGGFDAMQSANIALGGSVTLDVWTDNTTLEVFEDKLRVKGNIGNGHLENSSITLNGGDGLSPNSQTVSLGNAISLNVDATVVRTAGHQVIGGVKAWTDTGYFSDDLFVGGDLTVSGTTTTVHSQEVDVGDRIIRLNADQPTTLAPQFAAGFEIARGTRPTAQFLWNEPLDVWTSTNAGGTAYEVITKEKIIRNTISLPAVCEQKVDFRELHSHTFSSAPSVTLSVQGVDSTADVVIAQLSMVETTGFVCQFTEELTGNYKLHYVAASM